jgi:hypothetical protein
MVGPQHAPPRWVCDPPSLSGLWPSGSKIVCGSHAPLTRRRHHFRARCSEVRLAPQDKARRIRPSPVLMSRLRTFASRRRQLVQLGPVDVPDLEVPSAAWCAWVQARRTCPDRQWPRAGRTFSMAGVKQVRQPFCDILGVFKLWRPRRRHLICTCSGGLSSGERPRASRAPEQSHLSSYEGARLRHPPRRRAARVTDMALRGVSTGGSALGSSHAVGGAESGLCVGGRGARLHRLPGGGGGHLRGSSEGARPPWGLELVPKPPPGASCRLLTEASSCSQAPV